MKKQVYNPYLPLNTYIPDGEPHVFGDRVYIYGSHDREGGDRFCELDYECFSAPVDDLSDWRSEGIIYKCSQDPHITDNRQDMYAPDVVRGGDGRYYLYYALGGFEGPISVAVCDTPAGKYEYLGDVHYPDGRMFDRYIPFDPGVINDDGQIRLYYGWGLGYDLRQMDEQQVMPIYKMLFGKEADEVSREALPILGANTVALADDMLTVLGEPARVLDAAIAAKPGTPLYDHAFFEAASIRKFNGLYYFIYSSSVNHELCYATSHYPDRDFTYRGVIISNGDIGYAGRRPEDRLAATGTNHGSIECIKGKYYIFYHRNTHNTSFSRQGCAEPITLGPDGTIAQVEMTSCGLNGGPLMAQGEYPAAIACNLTHGHMPHLGQQENPGSPNINHEGALQFITDIEDRTWIGFKYFQFEGNERVSVTTRGRGSGMMCVATALGGEVLARIPVGGGTADTAIDGAGDVAAAPDGAAPDAEIAPAGVSAAAKWRTSSPAAINVTSGIHALYFCFEGTGTIDFLKFCFEV